MRKLGCVLSVLFTLKAEATTRCGVHFQTPKGWTVTRVTDKELKGCRVGLKPAGWDMRRRKSEFWIPDYALYVTVSNHSVDDVAGIAGFDRVGLLRDEHELPDRFLHLADDDWLIDDKVLHEAARIHGTTWRGVVGEALTRTRGLHPSSSVEQRVLFIEKGTHARTAFAWCELPAPCEHVLPSFTASFRFLP
jgi:hypothetical protein